MAGNGNEQHQELFAHVLQGEGLGLFRVKGMMDRAQGAQRESSSRSQHTQSCEPLLVLLFSSAAGSTGPQKNRQTTQGFVPTRCLDR